MRGLNRIEKIKNAETPVDKAVAINLATAEIAAEFERIQKPKGEIPGLTPLLDARRLQYSIPNGAFKLQAAFDVCLVHQLPRYEGETYGDTSIVMPETAKRRVADETPRGVLVAAGLRALDCLRSNGIDLGHIVSFIRQAPWRMPIENIAGADFHLMILRVGDITGSEDLREAVVSGACRLEWDDETAQHWYVDSSGKRWNPQVPFIPEDY